MVAAVMKFRPPASGAPPVQGQIFEIGPGKTWEELHDFTWDILQPGDQVHVLWRDKPYCTKWQMSKRGAPGNPIWLVGVPGPNGEKPVISGQNAIEWTGVKYVTDEIANIGLLTITRRGDEGPEGYKAGWIAVRDLQFQDANRDNTFKSVYFGDGAQWGGGNPPGSASGVAMYWAEYITFRGCIFTANENGAFWKSYDGGQGLVDTITFEDCAFYSNGYPGSDHVHNAYGQGRLTTYRRCYFGPLVPGAQGVAGPKDRSAGFWLDCCRIESGGDGGGTWLIDLVEPQDWSSAAESLPEWGQDFVTGCLIIDKGVGVGKHSGWDDSEWNVYGDPTSGSCARPHTQVDFCTFYTDVPGAYDVQACKVMTGGEASFQNCIMHAIRTAQSPGYWVGTAGGDGPTSVIDLARNWATSGIIPCSLDQNGNPMMTVNGWDQMIFGPDPGFKDVANNDFGLADGSPCKGGVQNVEVGRKYPRWQWDQATGWFVPRKMITDLGAIQS